MSQEQIIGGGAKKVLYTLNTVRRMGVVKSAKALRSKNTCKACALGMGGQQGGMTNELGEFPSVCNKSVQAQSTDIQPAIPEEIFTHTLAELGELTPKEMQGLGRLNTPIYKSAGDNHYTPISWDAALEMAAKRLRETEPARSFFYASGRSSNEAAFIFQLLARSYGTNNVTNCSYYCHQATGVGLKSTIGTGTATVEVADLGLCDMIFVIGANPASNHPRFIHQLEACRARGGQVVVINPARESGLVKFAVPKSPRSMLKGGSEIASDYLQPRIGQDVALLMGIAKALLESGQEDSGFIAQYTKGFKAFKTRITDTAWEILTAQCGVSREEIERVAALYGASNSTVFAWGMGMTHHRNGVDNIEMIAGLALMRGMMGRRGAGLLPLRGHSNVQGVGTNGVKPVLADDVIKKIETEFKFKFPRAKGLDTMGSMQAASRGEVDAAVIMGGNLYAANPDAKWAEAALDNIGFKLFLTTTLNHGHIKGCSNGESLILPVTARDEEWEPTTQESMFNFVRLSDGGITRLDNVRPESVILADLASTILPDSPINFQAFKSHKTVRAAIADIVPGMGQLADIDVARKEFHIQNRLIHKPVFQTSDGKAQFKAPILPPVLLQDKPAPFTLSTLRSEGQFNSMIYEEFDSYRGTKTRWCVMMNIEDIRALGLSPEDHATVHSAQGKMENVKLYAYDVPRGDMLAYYPEANILTSTDIDPRSCTPAFKSTRVWIEA